MIGPLAHRILSPSAIAAVGEKHPLQAEGQISGGAQGCSLEAQGRILTRRQEMYGVEASSMHRRRARARVQAQRYHTAEMAFRLATWRDLRGLHVHVVKYVCSSLGGKVLYPKKTPGVMPGVPGRTRDTHGTHGTHGRTDHKDEPHNHPNPTTQGHIYTCTRTCRTGCPPAVRGKEKTPSPCVGKKRLPCRALASTFVALAT